MRNFDEWFKTMRSCINGYGFYVNFEKVYENANRYKQELNLLNSLIGSKNIRQEFEELCAKYPAVLSCIPTLLAVRQSEIYAQDESGAHIYDFENINCSLADYSVFMEKTGLFDLISNHVINNLYDYVMGIEVGLDSNGRKNRGGTQMEELVFSFIKETGAEVYTQMYIGDIEQRWGLDLSQLSGDNTSTKRWDFVVKTPHTVYLIETNFYSGGGSKLNETARSYKMIAEEAARTEGVDFIWITDGQGWQTTRKNLQETFNAMHYLFNLNDLENGVLEKLFK